MREAVRTLAALIAGAVAALLWIERQSGQTPAAPKAERAPEAEVAPDPQQAARIEALEAELAEQRAMRAQEPGDPHPGVDAIRAARVRALELERRLSEQRGDDAPRWFELEPPQAVELPELAAEHLPRVALRVGVDSVDAAALWRALGAMQEFAEASGGAWFEFDGDFARWCAESGHPHALDPDLPGSDDSRPSFEVERRVNRSGRMVVPTYLTLGGRKLYYIDDVAGETGRMHVVGIG